MTKIKVKRPPFILSSFSLTAFPILSFLYPSSTLSMLWDSMDGVYCLPSGDHLINLFLYYITKLYGDSNVKFIVSPPVISAGATSTICQDIKKVCKYHNITSTLNCAFINITSLFP